MLGTKKTRQHAFDEAALGSRPTQVMVSGRTATAAEVGEHEALAKLHEARAAYASAIELTTRAERALVDASELMAEARKAVRRASER